MPRLTRFVPAALVIVIGLTAGWGVSHLTAYATRGDAEPEPYQATRAAYDSTVAYLSATLPAQSLPGLRAAGDADAARDHGDAGGIVRIGHDLAADRREAPLTRILLADDHRSDLFAELAEILGERRDVLLGARTLARAEGVCVRPDIYFLTDASYFTWAVYWSSSRRMASLLSKILRRKCSLEGFSCI